MTEPIDAYTGTDNLEAMSKAVNYNGYLVNLIAQYLRGSQTVLDFGAGLGDFAVALTQRGMHVVGLDTDEAHRDAMARRGLLPIAALSDVPADSLDAVYTLNVLEHIRDDTAVIGELGARIKEDGLLFIYVPAHQFLFTSMDRKVGHYRRYSRSHLEGALRSQGFDIVASGYVDSLGVIATLLYRVIGSKKGDLSVASVVIYDRFIFPIGCVLDRVFGRRIGKNLFAVGRKGALSSTGSP